MNKKFMLLLPTVAAMMLAGCGPTTPAASSSNTTTDTSSSQTPVAPTVTGVTITAAEGATSVGIGKTLQLTAAVTGTGAFSQLVTWKSSADATATVSSTGLVAGVAAGVVTITATSKTDTTKTATIELTVEEAVDKVSDINAIGVNYNIKVKVIGKDLQDVAFADASGIIYAYYGSGKATDTYKIADIAVGDYYNIKGSVGYYYGVWQFYPNGGSDSNKATIPAVTLTKLTEAAPTIDETPVELTTAIIDAHKATTSDWNNKAIKFVKYQSALTIEVGSSYNTYKTLVGTYDTRLHSLDTTVFTGLKNGVLYDIVGLDFGWNSGSNYQNVLVTKMTKVDVALTGITVTGPTSVYVGKTITLATQAAPAGADGSATWTSATPAVATVDPNTGVVTGVAAGTSVITATSTVDSAKTATFMVTVVAGLPALPLTGTFNKALPTDWSVAEEGYPSYAPSYYTDGSLKVNYEKIYAVSPSFVASTATGVSVAIEITALNAGSKTATAAATDPVFTITGYKADGTTVVGTATILLSQITAVGTFTATVAGADISSVKVYTTNLPTSGTKKANMGVKSIVITAAA
jgi:uncharacterized protein YjdB